MSPRAVVTEFLKAPPGKACTLLDPILRSDLEIEAGSCEGGVGKLTDPAADVPRDSVCEDRATAEVHYPGPEQAEQVEFLLRKVDGQWLIVDTGERTIDLTP